MNTLWLYLAVAVLALVAALAVIGGEASLAELRLIDVASEVATPVPARPPGPSGP